MPIRDETAVAIAQSLLDPFIKMNLVTDAALLNAVEIIKLRIDTEDAQCEVERAEAAAQTHRFIAKALRRAR